MQNETHYYLLNGTVKKGGKMPGEFSCMNYNLWLSSLQPCEISESEFYKIINHVYPTDIKTHYPENPIDITDIVEDNNGVITFKQPKQVESECEAVEFLNWVLSSGYKLNPHSEENKWRHYEKIESVKPILDDGITTKQLYEIFKNR